MEPNFPPSCLTFLPRSTGISVTKLLPLQVQQGVHIDKRELLMQA